MTFYIHLHQFYIVSFRSIFSAGPSWSLLLLFRLWVCKAPHKPLILSTYSFLCVQSPDPWMPSRIQSHISSPILTFSKVFLGLLQSLALLSHFLLHCLYNIYCTQRQSSKSKWIVFKFLKVTCLLFGPQDAFTNSEIVVDCIFQIWLQQYLPMSLSRTPTPPSRNGV